MKKIIALMLGAVVLLGTVQTSEAAKKKDDLSAYLPSGVSLKKASEAQISKALGKALQKNPDAAESFLAKALSNPKVSGNSDLVLSLASRAAQADPSAAMQIFSSSSSLLSGSALQSLVSTMLSINSSPAFAVQIFQQALASGKLSASETAQLAKTVAAAAPQAKTLISQAVAANTGGKVNSKEI